MGRSILELIIDRFNHMKYPLYLTTTWDSKKTLEQVANYDIGVHYHKPPNVLGGFVSLSRMYNLSGIFRICADNPLIQLPLMFPISAHTKNNKYDYITWKNAMYRHEGFFLEYISRKALDLMSCSKLTDREKSNVTEFARNNPDKCSVFELPIPEMLDKIHLRLTVDTKKDFKMAQKVYNAVGEKHWFSILEYVGSHPKVEEEMLKNIKENPK